MADTTPLANSPTVFVLDDDCDVRDTIVHLAQQMSLDCETFASGREFLGAFDPSRPGCLVAEVCTADTSGLEVQRRLAALGASLPIVFLSAQATVPLIVGAMQLGASGFLQKPASEHDLWEAVQEAVQEDARRREYLARQNARSEMLCRLEPFEHRMLELLAQGSTLREVARELGIAMRTAEVRRNRLMEKVQVGSQVELLLFAFALLYGTRNDGPGEYRLGQNHPADRFRRTRNLVPQ